MCVCVCGVCSHMYSRWQNLIVTHTSCNSNTVPDGVTLVLCVQITSYLRRELTSISGWENTLSLLKQTAQAAGQMVSSMWGRCVISHYNITFSPLYVSSCNSARALCKKKKKGCWSTTLWQSPVTFWVKINFSNSGIWVNPSHHFLSLFLFRDQVSQICKRSLHHLLLKTKTINQASMTCQHSNILIMQHNPLWITVFRA